MTDVHRSAEKVVSRLCKEGRHEWCMNRSHEESHCQCECHARTSNLESIPDVILDAEQVELAYQLKGRWERINSQWLIPISLTRYIVHLHDENAKLRRPVETTGRCLVPDCTKPPMPGAFCEEHNATVGAICGTAVALEPAEKAVERHAPDCEIFRDADLDEPVVCSCGLAQKTSDAQMIDNLARAGCTCPFKDGSIGKHKAGCPAFEQAWNQPGECTYPICRCKGKRDCRRAESPRQACQHDPTKPGCTLRHQFTEGRTRCDTCGGIFTPPVSRAGHTCDISLDCEPCDRGEDLKEHP